MKTYIALLRGINVGGHNKLPMRGLAALLEGLGLTHVKTYIQSGNVVFQTPQAEQGVLAERISRAVEQQYGFMPKVMILSFAELTTAVSQNPFPEATQEPKTLHFYFLKTSPPSPDLEVLEAIKKDSERFKLKDKVFYLHAPDGIGRSKVAAKVEKALGVATTARNWRTVSKVLEMATAVADI